MSGFSRTPHEVRLKADTTYLWKPRYIDKHALAAVVIAILFVVAMFVPLLVSVPVMVVTNVAAIAFPATGIVPSASVVGGDPVRTGIRRPRPVTVVPSIVRSLRVLVAFDPYVFGAGWRRHAVRPWGRWRTDVNVNGHLGMGRRAGDE